MDASGLTNLLSSVLNFYYNKNEGEGDLDAAKVVVDPLKDENNKNFSLAFLTRFALKGY